MNWQPNKSAEIGQVTGRIWCVYLTNQVWSQQQSQLVKKKSISIFNKWIYMLLATNTYIICCSYIDKLNVIIILIIIVICII